ncbi:MAG: hypothetical protein AB1782_16020 [Cyanobacteriota bacterium]
MKTMLAKVLVEKPNDAEGVDIIDEKSLQNLDKLINDYHRMRYAILEDLYKRFKTNPGELIEKCGSIVKIHEYNINPSLYKNEEGEVFETEFTCQECNKKQYVYYYETNISYNFSKTNIQKLKKALSKEIFEHFLDEIGEYKGNSRVPEEAFIELAKTFDENSLEQIQHITKKPTMNYVSCCIDTRHTLRAIKLNNDF